MTNQNNTNASKLSIQDLISREINELKRQDKRMSSGVIFREVATKLEATQLTITQELRSDIYDEIEKQLRSQIRDGKDWRVKSLSFGAKLDSASLSWREQQSTTLQSAKDLPLEQSLKLSFIAYEKACKAQAKAQTEGTFKRKMKFKRLVNSAIYTLKQSGNPESITLADNYEKGLALIENPVSTQNVPIERDVTKLNPLPVNSEGKELTKEQEDQIAEIEKQFRKGNITPDEMERKIADIKQAPASA